MWSSVPSPPIYLIRRTADRDPRRGRIRRPRLARHHGGHGRRSSSGRCHRTRHCRRRCTCGHSRGHCRHVHRGRPPRTVVDDLGPQREHRRRGRGRDHTDADTETWRAFSPPFPEARTRRAAGNDRQCRARSKCRPSSTGPTSEEVAALVGTDVTAVVEQLCDATLEVAFIGFSPGFPYLVGLPEGLAGVPGGQPSNRGRSRVSGPRRWLRRHLPADDAGRLATWSDRTALRLFNPPPSVRPSASGPPASQLTPVTADRSGDGRPAAGEPRRADRHADHRARSRWSTRACSRPFRTPDDPASPTRSATRRPPAIPTPCGWPTAWPATTTKRPLSRSQPADHGCGIRFGRTCERGRLGPRGCAGVHRRPSGGRLGSRSGSRRTNGHRGSGHPWLPRLLGPVGRRHHLARRRVPLVRRPEWPRSGPAPAR